MADVIDVVHKITYEVDDKALQNAVILIKTQVDEITKLTKQVDSYTTRIKTIGDNDIKSLDSLLSKIKQTDTALQASSSKLNGLLKEVVKGLAEGLGASDGLKEAVKGYVSNIVTELKGLDKTAKGTGASLQNMWHTTASTGTSSAAKTTSALSALGKGLSSVTGLVDIGINLLIAFSDELLTSSERIGLVTDEMEVYNAINRQAAEETAKVSTEMGVLKTRFFDASAGVNEKTKVVNELNEKYGDTIGKLNGISEAEDFFVNRSDAFVKAMTLRAKIQGAYNLIAANQQKLLEAQSNSASDNIGWGTKTWSFLKAAVKNPGMFGRFKIGTDYNRYIEDENQAMLKDAETKNAETDVAIQANIIELGREVDALSKQNNFNFDGYKKTIGSVGLRTTSVSSNKLQPKISLKTAGYSEADELMAKELAKNVVTNDASDKLKERISAINTMELWQNTEAEKAYANGLRTYEEYEKQKLEIKQRFAEERLKAEIANLKELVENKDIPEADKEAFRQKLGSAELELVQTTNAEKHNKEVEDKKAKDDAETKRQERIKETVAAYQNLAAEAVKAINTIYDAQIKSLDNEIKVRERRVEQAKKLAERGNAEVLKMEEERLAEAQKKKEAYAKKEAILNAALAFSNSLVAVTGAVANAVKGDPYTVAARVAAAIAAVLAALGSGYAFVQSFKSEGAFADGVVDFRGKGGPRDDANWVRISSGESVITAEGTRQNRQLLEAINSGAKLQFFNPALAYTMPVFASPGNSTKSYASQNDLRNVETKLDGVIAAIEDNRMKQNIFFNEHGVGVMTERAMRRDRKRWM